MKLNKNNIEKLERKVFSTLIIFLSIIITIYILADTYMFSNQFKKISLDNAITKVEERENYLKNYINISIDKLNNINNSEIFKNYLIKNETEKSLKDLFKIIVKNQKNIMQLRYINKEGFEKIRVDRKAHSSEPFVVNKSALQNKSNRYYFQKSKSFNKNEVWFSSLDLNMENGEIEKPYKLTLRAILPLQLDNEFNGILIINYFMNDYLKEFMKDGLYNSILLDENGYTILHHEDDKSWGKFKNEKISYVKDKNILIQKQYKGDNYVSKILDLPLEEKFILILELNKKYLKEERHGKILSKIYTSLIIVFFLGIATFIILRILKQHILELSHYGEYTELIDENIITSTTDLEGKITFVSKAFCKISGYLENELLGKNHNIVRHPDESSEKYKELWKNLLENKVWEGEFKNKNKKGDTYWVSAKIYPIFEDGIKVGYTAVRHDITDKKIIEELSIRDGLTNLYNRKHFQDTLGKFINISKRNKSMISFLMIDVDHFKEYNDTYGHHEGDNVLIQIANVLQSSLKRANDYSFRIGGEEFVVLFNCSKKEDAIHFSQYLKNSIEELKIKHTKNSASSYVTISLGLICLESDVKTDSDSIYKQADKLLYEAKENGRNLLVYNED